ncbi:MAG: TonB-dependent receptor, partial [Thermodesulfovibrionia bacterium]|nr:TonB-dependent receptor [Thermodesulfovibrionia bacterium]
VGLGYKKSRPRRISIGRQEETKAVTLYLEPLHSMMEVVVTEDRNRDKTAKIIVSGKELVSVPGSSGDPLRGMQALPGITTSNDFSSNPAIRGTGPEDNAYYVDFMPVGYLFHMGGLVSVVNADLVDNFNIYASAFGPEFADATGGIIDIKLRSPRKDRLGVKLNISTMEADVLIEGPIADNQAFYLGARRSYVDLLLPGSGEFEEGFEYTQFPQYYDYQGKYVWDISQNNSLTFQLSGAKDQLKITLTDEADSVKNDPVLAGDYDMEVSYHTQGILLKSRISPRVSNKLGISNLITDIKQRTTSLGHAIVDVNDYIVRDHMTVAIADDHEILLGVDYTHSDVKLDLDTVEEVPSDFDPDTDYTSSDRFTNDDRIRVDLWALALKDRWQIIDKVILVIGGRASYENYLDNHAIEPRLGAEYSIAKDTLIMAGWGKYHQFPAAYQTIDGIGNPDLDYIRAEHYDMGVSQQFIDKWSVKVEGYFKELDDTVVPHETDNYVNGGSGIAYGTEVLVKKDRTGGWWGWLSASYSKTERQNDLTGEEFPYEYDQPVIINIVYSWEFASMWTFGVRWRFQSGAPFTPVEGTYTDSTGRTRPIYGELGSERLPDYHRLDLRVSKEFLFNRWKMEAYLDIINAYNRENISGYQYEEDYTSREPVTQLPILPSIGIKAEF